jgi:hypothetical protein
VNVVRDGSLFDFRKTPRPDIEARFGRVAMGHQATFKGGRLRISRRPAPTN